MGAPRNNPERQIHPLGQQQVRRGDHGLRSGGVAECAADHRADDSALTACALFAFARCALRGTACGRRACRRHRISACAAHGQPPAGRRRCPAAECRPDETGTPTCEPAAGGRHGPGRTRQRK